MSNQTNSRKLQSRITPPREEYFMGKLLVEAVLCRDNIETKAALILDHKDRQVGFGVTFIPKPDFVAKEFGSDERTRELCIVHAEEVAIDQVLKRYIPGNTVLEPFDRHTLFITGPPSLRGVRKAIANELRNIIYGPIMPQYFDDVEWEETKELAKAYAIKMTYCDGNLGWVRDRILSLSHLF